MRSDLWLRTADITDADAIAAIYNHYVDGSTITFEERAVAPEEMAGRIREVRSNDLPWYVAIQQDSMVGYAYATPWKSRSAYRFSAELTVYVAPGHLHQGIGTRLYQALLDTLRQSGFHAVIGGIALPNPGSVAMHERLGFEQVAHLREVGFKMDRWIDVGYWQRLLETGD